MVEKAEGGQKDSGLDGQYAALFYSDRKIGPVREQFTLTEQAV